MGYTTRFEGELRFTNPISVPQLVYLNQLIENKDGTFREHIDLEVTRDYSGLKWNLAEKTYGMDEAVEYILQAMSTKFPDFGLVGVLKAQGEDVDDRWELRADGRTSVRVDTPPTGPKVICPHCRSTFRVGG